MELDESLAVVTVTDTGSGFKREEVEEVGTARLDDGVGINGFDGGRFGGFGLPMVESLADSVEYFPANPHGTVVRATRRFTLNPK
jgi:anti-sigma regulatory factor (Ser/Thr protein kinase)